MYQYNTINRTMTNIAMAMELLHVNHKTPNPSCHERLVNVCYAACLQPAEILAELHINFEFVYRQMKIYQIQFPRGTGLTWLRTRFSIVPDEV